MRNSSIEKQIFSFNETKTVDEIVELSKFAGIEYDHKALECEDNLECFDDLSDNWEELPIKNAVVQGEWKDTKRIVDTGRKTSAGGMQSKCYTSLESLCSALMTSSADRDGKDFSAVCDSEDINWRLRFQTITNEDPDVSCRTTPRQSLLTPVATKPVHSQQRTQTLEPPAWTINVHTYDC
ncbi:hypothetical protein AVEN_128496-1 [Araneus ventricosus]|uniref:Uncharacterized protein n=1 Tax=Araneus ventricosus TaxID=182803 RepID=A0A4Y2FPT2_ARAVE|nr:hypothetical protein AVEN_128496-1 [Araneus ventricosus]